MRILLFAVSLNLLAYTLPEGSLGISPIREVALVALTQKPCKGVCSLLELEFTLLGCNDQLGPVYLKTKIVEDRYLVFLNPLNIHMQDSVGVRCFLPKKVRKTFELDKEINIDNLYFSYLREMD